MQCNIFIGERILGSLCHWDSRSTSSIFILFSSEACHTVEPIQNLQPISVVDRLSKWAYFINEGRLLMCLRTSALTAAAVIFIFLSLCLAHKDQSLETQTLLHVSLISMKQNNAGIEKSGRLSIVCTKRSTPFYVTRNWIGNKKVCIMMRQFIHEGLIGFHDNKTTATPALHGTDLSFVYHTASGLSKRFYAQIFHFMWGIHSTAMGCSDDQKQSVLHISYNKLPQTLKLWSNIQLRKAKSCFPYETVAFCAKEEVAAHRCFSIIQFLRLKSQKRRDNLIASERK